MAKRVVMVAEILEDQCTGCNRCVLACPTVAITMRPRRPDEPGPGRNIAVVEENICYNAQNCMEVCPDDAIVMCPLDEPFEVGVSDTGVSSESIGNLCMQVGLLPDMLVCVCTDTLAGELAEAILDGAHTPEDVARRTGARTGCTEICLDPILRLLAAAGHGDPRCNPRNGWQWYGIPGRLMNFVSPDGQVDPELVAAYPHLPMQKDVNAMLFKMDEA
ncbi:(2Fe-2S)-binding protein [Mycobacterium sp.]|uniref:(2Fe-2S)-binding protein n=1 Tax=Mycobacterium sp. TaxID=1785 RepID=UPI00121AD9CE|nr:(2Fe-2S)-binding protein [Mycobacterium sp.]TAM64492.1 MAG: 4Fe-4S dicluster domain-containing protein [Mycobacterium sp.]